MSKFKEGDTVYFYVRPGTLELRKIESIVDDSNVVHLEGHDSWVLISDLFLTPEEGAKALSPATKRMRGCLIQSKRIYGDAFPGHAIEDGEISATPGILSTVTDAKSHILRIAFKLFDAGGD